MKKLLFAASAFALVIVGSVSLIPTEAEAIPVFARKYGMACNSCHTMFPQLSKMGVAFRERGFRFAAGRDDVDSQDDRGANFVAAEDAPSAVFASTFPFTVRTQLFYSNAYPQEVANASGTEVPVMPGHRMGMLGGAKNNAKIGIGELGLISSGSYDNFSWWMDANNNGIGMLEGIYYVNDLFKIRLGRIQNNVGYGMTMMAKRPLGYGWGDASIMAGGTMLMMVDGIGINGTTNGDSGVGTYYNFSYGLNGNGKNYSDLGGMDANPNAGQKQTTIYGRVAQEIMDNHIVGVYGYQAKNYNSASLGGEAAMLMNMNGTARAMFFDKVTRYGVDFAINYGEPLQLWGGYTVGTNTSTDASATGLKVTAFTVASEWIATDGWMLGAKYNSSKAALKMGTNAAFTPDTTTNLTLYGIHQLAQNVQAILSYTQTKNLVTNMRASKAMTTQEDFNTVVFAIDIAL